MQANPATNEWTRTLRRSHQGRLIAGVAAGLADYFDVDVVLVRVALAVLAVAGGIGVPLYLAAWLLVPDEGQDEGVVEHLLGRGGAGCASGGGGPQPSGTTMASAPGWARSPWSTPATPWAPGATPAADPTPASTATPAAGTAPSASAGSDLERSDDVPAT